MGYTLTEKYGVHSNFFRKMEVHKIYSSVKEYTAFTYKRSSDIFSLELESTAFIYERWCPQHMRMRDVANIIKE